MKGEDFLNPKDLENEMQLRQALKVMKEQAETYGELYRLLANARKTHFDALVEQGFSHGEALYITAHFNPFSR